MTEADKAALRASFRAQILNPRPGSMFAPAFIAEAFEGFEEMRALLGEIAAGADPLTDPKIRERAKTLAAGELPPPAFIVIEEEKRPALRAQLRRAIRRYPSGFQLATELVVEAFGPLQEIVDQLACVTVDPEDHADSTRILEEFVRSAGPLSDVVRPKPALHPDIFTFKIREPDPACSECKGTGEVVDYPPDDDERLIACGRCGGTGEGLRQ